MSELILWKNQEMNKMRRDMERLFNRFWYGFRVPVFPGEIAETPSINLSETEDALLIRAEFPDVNPEDMDISVTGDTLVIKAVTRDETVETGAGYHRVKRRSGSFSRTIPLPCKVKVDEIKAIYEEGILNITMPKCKPDEACGIRIEVRKTSI